VSSYQPYELHCHTYHSDGQMSPEQLLKSAIKRGYKGIGLSDHNTFSATDEVIELSKKLDIVILKGIEWTTFWGHLTAFNTEGIVDWRDINYNNINAIIEKACKAGAIISVAHPKRMGAPYCAGCHMDFPISKFEYITCFEIWSEPSPQKAATNKIALAWYDELLAKGYRLTAVYGYDWHSEDRDKCYGATYIGSSKTEDQVLSALKKGDTFTSIGLSIDLSIDGKCLPFGSEISKGNHSFAVKIGKDNETLCEKYQIRPKKLVIKGTALKQRVFDIDEIISFNLDLNEGYFRIEALGNIDNEKDMPLLFTSPIYIKEAN